MQALPSLRLTVNLNAVLRFRRSPAQAAAAVVGDDVAHHVVDPEDLLGIDPLRATALADAIAVIAGREQEMWVLALPQPGAPGALRGPVGLNRAALEAGEVVLAGSGGIALVPHAVGRGVQWRVHPAERPFTPLTSYDAERALSETVISAAATLARLDVAAGSRPASDPTADLAPGYSSRQRLAADRAARLLLACETALSSDGAAVSAYEASVRAVELRRLHRAAADALCAAASWMG
ncbi:hypothetical protein [uncultured Friedmanniella sp.]|uniref:hypothetical protein n=1 Tax=uncultured Friedmanniella sp. TaxID=335381 RepID=UPI0035C95E39